MGWPWGECSVRLLHELAGDEDEGVRGVLRIIYCLSLRVWGHLKAAAGALCPFPNKLGSPQPAFCGAPALRDLREHPRGGGPRDAPPGRPAPRLRSRRERPSARVGSGLVRA